MIQRIQSLFYLLSAIAVFLLFKFDFASSNQSTPGMLADSVYEIQDHIVLLVLTILGGLTSLGAILLFKNRPLQIRIGYLSIVLSILLPLVAFLLIYNEGTPLKIGTDIEDGVGIYLPLIAIIFTILGNRFTKKDEKLVRSMDRLR